mmetsp:Transcript_3106/g.6186  ORF Transcript_3106/g.6186 Transcript_3106/m.6186 type:complete len:205 (-) Transcript_3106:280-894(-)
MGHRKALLKVFSTSFSSSASGLLLRRELRCALLLQMASCNLNLSVSQCSCVLGQLSLILRVTKLSLGVLESQTSLLTLVKFLVCGIRRTSSSYLHATKAVVEIQSLSLDSLVCLTQLLEVPLKGAVRNCALVGGGRKSVILPAQIGNRTSTIASSFQARRQLLLESCHTCLFVNHLCAQCIFLAPAPGGLCKESVFNQHLLGQL